MGKRTFSIQSLHKALELAETKEAPPKERVNYQEILNELYPSIQKMLKNGHTLASVVDFLNSDCEMNVVHSTFIRYYREEHKKRSRKNGSKRHRQVRLEPVPETTNLASQAPSNSSSTTVINFSNSQVNNKSSEFRDVDDMEL